MKKVLCIILLLSVFSNADINTKVENIIGYSAYNKHKNLINYIFKNTTEFYDSSNKIDYTKLAMTLKNNNLLKLKYEATKYIDITFIVTNHSKKSIKILKDVLRTLGHYYYFTKQMNKTNEQAKWIIKLKTAAAISPLRLSQELQKNACNILDIKKEGENWNYFIDTNNSSIYKASDLVNNNFLSLRKVSKEYFIKINSANAINIVSNSANLWHPNVIFYDNELNIIESYQDENLQKNLRLEVPIDTKYIKIDDLHTLVNLKRGFNITKE